MDTHELIACTSVDLPSMLEYCSCTFWITSEYTCRIIYLSVSAGQSAWKREFVYLPINDQPAAFSSSCSSISSLLNYSSGVFPDWLVSAIFCSVHDLSPSPSPVPGSHECMESISFTPSSVILITSGLTVYQQVFIIPYPQRRRKRWLSGRIKVAAIIL